MGLLSKATQLLGFGKSQAAPRGVDIGMAKDSFSEIFGGNTSAPSFSTFNGMRAQMLAYYDWVYAAASRVAEEASCIDIELYINRTEKKTATVGRKMLSNTKALQKYKKQRLTKTSMVVKNGGRIYVNKAGAAAIEEVEDSPLMDLLDRPNKFMSGAEFFELTFLHLELTGNAFWAIIRDKKKQPVELWPLYPNYMRIVPHEKDFISGYVYTINGEQIPFLPEDIIHHKYSNPNDLRWGMSTVMASARAIDTDTMASDYNRKFFYNSAQPDAVLYTDEMIDDKTWLRIKDQFQDMYGGTANAHKTAILESGLKYQAMNPNQREMEFLKSREFNRDMILAMFGVPKSVLGMDASMSRANAETAEYVFAKGTIRPKLMRITAGIQEKLAPMFDERLIVTFVDPVPDDKAYKLNEHKQLANLVLTANEVREDMGYEPIDNGDTLYVLGNMVPIGTPVASTQTAPEETDQETDNGEDIHGDDDSGDGGSAAAGDTSGSETPAAAEGDAKAFHGKRTKQYPMTAETVPDGCKVCICCVGWGEHNTGFECYRCDGSGYVDDEENKQPIPCGGREDSDELWIDEDGTYRHNEERSYRKGGTFKGNGVLVGEETGAPVVVLPEPNETQRLKVNGGLTYVGQSPVDTNKDVTPTEYLNARNKVADKYEPKVFNGVLAHMADQEKEVLANLPKRLKAIQANTTKRVIKANLENLFDPEKSVLGWQSRLSVIFEQIIAAMGLISVKQLADALGEDQEPYDPHDPSVEAFYTERIRRISVYFDLETQKQLGATLREGIDAGESVDDLRKRVMAIYQRSDPKDVMWYRAERIGRTEPIFATTWTTIDSWKKNGHVIGKRWHTAPGAVPAENNPCGFCRNMNEKIVELDSNYFDLGDSMSYEDDQGNTQTMKLNYVDTIGPPLHPNCVVGDTTVVAPDAKKILKGTYSGQLVKITLASGRALTVTPNHPVLTDRGFLAAKFINNGHKLIANKLTNRIIRNIPDDNLGVTSIEQIFSALAKTSHVPSVAVPIAPEDFHNDGQTMYGDVHIVGSDSLLVDNIEASMLKQFANVFLDTSWSSSMLPSSATLQQGMQLLALTFDCAMSSADLRHAFTRIATLPDNPISLTTASRYDARIFKAQTNDITTDSQLASDVLDGFTELIEFDDVINIDVCTVHNAPVYDIESTSTVYTANGIIVSNCRCTLLPVLVGESLN